MVRQWCTTRTRISATARALMQQAATADTMLICRTRFRREGAELSWHVFFVPNAEMRERMRLVTSMHLN